MEAIAHIDTIGNKEQSVKEHSFGVAKIAASFAIKPLQDVVFNAGLLHDIGKYQKSFQERIRGKTIAVEHSGCGAQVCLCHTEKCLDNQLMAYIIAGHHGGIPDGGSLNDSPDMLTLYSRAKREYEDYSQWQKELSLVNVSKNNFLRYLLCDCENDWKKAIDKYAFLVRYAYSCLVDGDSLDTAAFGGELIDEKLSSDFVKALTKVGQRTNAFAADTSLQKARTVLKEQAIDNLHKHPNANIYLLNMPTGAGKTLTGVSMALEQAVRLHKKRIIYVIPYNSIIDQTAEEFEKTFGNDVQLLRHQSSYEIDEEEKGLEYKIKFDKAKENWQADFIITTMVQFFESIVSNRRSKLRKLHNMGDSILVFDEAHLMPIDYLQPCLQSVAYITKYLNSQAFFLTATMPDFKNLFEKYTIHGIDVVELISDKSEFTKFKKCKFINLGQQSYERLLERASNYPSTLIVVNKRKDACLLYQQGIGDKFHLSTFMTPYDRVKILKTIKEHLKKLEEDFPDGKVPAERKILVVATSLIEAGVDLDFHTVFRELNGLDNILQAGGRCNREGRRSCGEVFVYESCDVKLGDNRSAIAKSIMKEYPDISEPVAIADYYDRLFKTCDKEITSKPMSDFTKDINSLPFKEYAEQFHIIDDERTVSVVVERNEESRALIARLKATGTTDYRKMQQYTCNLYLNMDEELQKLGAVGVYGDIHVLNNLDYYDENTGLGLDSKNYIL